MKSPQRLMGWFDTICTDTTAVNSSWFRNDIMELHPCLLHLDQLGTFRRKTETTAENNVYQSLIHASRFTTPSHHFIDKREKLYGLQLSRFCHYLTKITKTTQKFSAKPSMR
ncbi:MAG: hypothetical protein M0O96_11355 [Desulforhopalus sp.]|nr:hypothetical protein [Desulforhopalus sp.]